MTHSTKQRTWSKTPDWHVATGRAAVYDLCVNALGWPSQDRLDSLVRLADMLREIELDEPALAADIAAVIEIIDSRPPVEELQAAHGLLFTQIDSQDCPPYETAFNGRDVFRQTEVMADVAGFYLAHGLRFGGLERERPDHILTELEFMAFMTHKEAWALEHLGEAEVTECRRTQDRFLADHLGCWGPEFGRRAEALGAHQLHVRAGRLVHDWIVADMAATGVEPVQSFDEPLPMPEPDDGECGPSCETADSRSTPVTLRRKAESS